MGVDVSELRKMLRLLGACEEAIEWVGERDLETAWAECERADWMLWLVVRMAGTEGWPTRQAVVLAACACAETVLLLFKDKYPEDNRPRVAVETAQRWAIGKATLDDVRHAAVAAAYAAYAAAAGDAARIKGRHKELAEVVRPKRGLGILLEQIVCSKRRWDVKLHASNESQHFFQRHIAPTMFTVGHPSALALWFRLAGHTDTSTFRLPISRGRSIHRLSPESTGRGHQIPSSTEVPWRSRAETREGTLRRDSS